MTNEEEIIDKLKTALEDMTAVCILEGFSKQEPMMLVDSIIKELGKRLYNGDPKNDLSKIRNIQKLYILKVGYQMVKSSVLEFLAGYQMV